MQTPSAIASTGKAITPKISATRSPATRSVNGLGRRSSEFALMAHLPAGYKSSVDKGDRQGAEERGQKRPQRQFQPIDRGDVAAPKSSLSFMSSIPRTRFVFSYKYGVSQRFHS
jgi:hypothetical protein